MGYTHYWKNSGKKATEEIKTKFNAIFQVMRDLDQTELVIDYHDNHGIWFNGKDNDAHETMVVTFNGGSKGFNFCKTARKPYDTMVVACLLLADELDLIDSWSSDGDDEPDCKTAGQALLGEAKRELGIFEESTLLKFHYTAGDADSVEVDEQYFIRHFNYDDDTLHIECSDDDGAFTIYVDSVSKDIDDGHFLYNEDNKCFTVNDSQGYEHDLRFFNVVPVGV